MTNIEVSIRRYCEAHYLTTQGTGWNPQAALIDMDGVLYDSMPGHARAWKQVMSEEGIPCTENEFFLYEGMTGKATIELLMRERLNRVPSPGEVERLYARKSDYFHSQGKRKPMPGADRMLRILQDSEIKRVLVTGSAQHSLLDSLEQDYPGAFLPEMRVTALDVSRGKPAPEPYLKGAVIAQTPVVNCIVIENAPLGVRAGHDAGCFTIGITTGPVSASVLYENGADIVFASMPEFANALPLILKSSSYHEAD